jgi:diguanylate cyclase (GGDEF)-like protein
MLLPFKDRKEERGQVELLQALLRLANQLQSNLDLDAVVDVIAVALGDTFGFTEVCVYVRDGEEPVLRARAVDSSDAQADQRTLNTPCTVATAEALFTEEYHAGSAFIVPADAPEWTEDLRRCLPRIADEDAGDERGSWHAGDSLLVPLYDKQRRLTGLLRLGAPITGLHPSPEVIASLSAFATHAAVAIENAREHQQLQEVTAQLEEQLEVRHQLLDGSRALLSTLDEVAVFAKISQMMDALVGYDALGIGLVDRAAGLIRPAFYAEDGTVVDTEATLSLEEPVLVPAFRTGRAVLIDDRTEGRPVLPVPGGANSPKSVILAPLAVGGEAFGLLGVSRYREEAERFGAREFELVQLFANLAAIALQNARSYKEMLHLASSDGLTGVHNYRHFRETLAMEVSRADRYDETFCLLMMDLDHFKAVNDTVGHQQGDEVLKAVAGILKQCSRESDYSARYGGEEFVMILPRTQIAEAATVAERIRSRVREIDAGSPALTVSMSIGVASHPRPDQDNDMDGVLRAADAGLLRAKAGGRNRVCLQAEDGTFPEPESELSSLGRRFAHHLGMSETEAAGVVAALALLPAADVYMAPTLPRPTRLEVDAAWSRAEALEALLYSTERWDGTGYPEGLRGSEIPPVARVCTLLRRFLAAGGKDEPVGAARGLWRMAGVELDPNLVHRFISFMSENHALETARCS